MSKRLVVALLFVLGWGAPALAQTPSPGVVLRADDQFDGAYDVQFQDAIRLVTGDVVSVTRADQTIGEATVIRSDGFTAVVLPRGRTPLQIGDMVTFAAHANTAVHFPDPDSEPPPIPSQPLPNGNDYQPTEPTATETYSTPYSGDSYSYGYSYGYNYGYGYGYGYPSYCYQTYYCHPQPRPKPAPAPVVVTVAAPAAPAPTVFRPCPVPLATGGAGFCVINHGRPPGEGGATLATTPTGTGWVVWPHGGPPPQNGWPQSGNLPGWNGASPAYTGGVSRPTIQPRPHAGVSPQPTSTFQTEPAAVHVVPRPHHDRPTGAVAQPASTGGAVARPVTPAAVLPQSAADINRVYEQQHVTSAPHTTAPHPSYSAPATHATSTAPTRPTVAAPMHPAPTRPTVAAPTHVAPAPAPRPAPAAAPTKPTPAATTKVKK